MLSHRRKHGPESPSPASLSALLMSTRNPSVMELPSSPQASKTILNVLDLFIVKERAALQGEIQRLQAENESLVKENGDLLQQIVSKKSLQNDSSPTIVAVDSEKVSREPRDDLVSTLLDKVHHYQRFLVKEREISALREASFEQNFRTMHKIVKDAMKTTVCEHQEHQEHQDHRNGSQKKSELPSMPTSPDPPYNGGISEPGDSIVNRIMKLTTALSRRTEEIKQIREVAEQKAEQATLRIAHLELKSEGLSLLRSHNNQVDLELDVLKLRLKKLETMALEFVPLSEQDVLLDFEEYKDELLKVQTKQKQRRKKEERWRLWRD